MSQKDRFTLFVIVSALVLFGTVHGAGAQSIDGAALYTQDCAGCHGSLASSSVAGKTAAQIQSAINSVGSMSGFKSLTAAQINAIASALNPSPPPPAPDTTPPMITIFSIPSTSSSLTVPIQALTATDNVAVTGYLITESSTSPSATSPGWSSTAPSSYTFASEGTKTLYAWAKDAAGNVSNGVSAQVAINLSNPSPQPPPQPGATDLTNWVGQWLQMKVKYDGYSFGSSNPGGSSENSETSDLTGSSGMGADHENIAVYLKFTSWDPNQGVLQGNLYQFDSNSGQWVHDTLSLHFVAGTSTDFLCWSQVNGEITTGFAARVQGKEKGGVLNSATFKTLGGYYLNSPKGTGTSSGSSGFLAGGLLMSGSLVPASKVPVSQ